MLLTFSKDEHLNNHQENGRKWKTKHTKKAKLTDIYKEKYSLENQDFKELSHLPFKIDQKR
jgi:hypothetical protein